MELKDYKEFRQIGTAEASATEIYGYAIMFNEWSNDLGNFYELINPEAVTQEFLKTQDVFAYFNHDENKVLGRNYRGEKGSLRLEIDSKGLLYSIPIKMNSALHQEVRELIQAGECLGSSFAFITKDSNCDWQSRKDGKYNRIIKKFDYLMDVSPVFTPAYQQTNCNTRFYRENVQLLNTENYDATVKINQLNMQSYINGLRKKHDVKTFAEEHQDYINYLRKTYNK
jgi:HK97 family phage prohead protease